MPSQKPILKSDPSTSKNYSYELGTVALRFSLRTDIKGDMKAFLEILAQATADITKDLKAIE